MSKSSEYNAVYRHIHNASLSNGELVLLACKVLSDCSTFPDTDFGNDLRAAYSLLEKCAREVWSTLKNSD